MTPSGPGRLALWIAVALAILPIAIVFRDLAAGRTYAESWEYAFDPVFAAARPPGMEPQDWWASRWDSSPATLVATSDRFCARSYRRLEAPLWNPHQGLGTPLAAEMNAPVLSPLRILMVYLPGGSDRAASVLSFLEFILSAVGVLLWLQSCGCSPLASACGALGYVFAGQAVAAFRFPNFPAEVLAPFLLWRLECLIRSRSVLQALITGAFAALILLSAHVMSAYTALLAVTLVSLVRLAGVLAREGVRSTARLGWLLAVAAFEAAALAAPAWMPFVEFLQNGITYKFSGSGATPTLHAVNLVAPSTDMPFGLAAAVILWGMAGAFIGSRLRVPALALIAFGLGHALGLPLLRRVDLLPGMSMVQPHYSLFAAALGACALMAAMVDGATRGARRAWIGAAIASVFLGVVAIAIAKDGNPALRNVLRSSELPRSLLAVGAILALWVGAILARRERGQVAAWSLGLTVFALCAAEVVPRALHEIRPEATFDFPETPALRFLREHTRDGSRVVGLSSPYLFWPGSSPHLPNVGLVTGVDDLRSMQALFVRRTRRLFFRMNEGPGAHATVLDLVDYPDALGRGANPEGRPTGVELLSTRFLLGSPGFPTPAGHRRVYADAQVSVDENPRAFPRAFLVHEVVRARDEDDADGRMRDIDYSRQVVIEGETPAVRAPASGEAASERATVERDGPRDVRVHVAARQSGIVVLSDAYYPGWTVTVDGRPGRIFPADLALRGVFVEPGSHELRFRYQPNSFRAGLNLCALGLLGLTASIALRIPVRRRRGGSRIPRHAGQ